MWPFKRKQKDERLFYPYSFMIDTRENYLRFGAGRWVKQYAQVYVIDEGMYLALEPMLLTELIESDQFMPIAKKR